MSSFVSPYASLEIPCDVCTLRCEAKSLRQKTIDENPSFDIEAYEEQLRLGDNDSDSGYGGSPPASPKMTSPWAMMDLKGPCTPTCAGVINASNDRSKAVEEAKKWLAMNSTEVKGRMPR